MKDPKKRNNPKAYHLNECFSAQLLRVCHLFNILQKLRIKCCRQMIKNEQNSTHNNLLHLITLTHTNTTNIFIVVNPNANHTHK